jgi:hypothetical protein
MSKSFGVPQQRRWAAKSMILKKWIAKNAIRRAEPICELETDGKVETLYIGERLHPDDDPAGVVWRYVAEGHEVQPTGQLLEFTDIHPSGSAELHASARINLTRRDQYPSIFLNYRRDDAESYAGRLHEVLVRAFGRDEVFMDLFSIRPGEVFAWTLQQAVVHARVVISVIGPNWAVMKDQSGKRLIDDENDFVRRELAAAFGRGISIIPLLVAGSDIPQRAGFQDALYPLQDLQFFELSTRHWETDVDEVVAAIKRYAEIAKCEMMDKG